MAESTIERDATPPATTVTELVGGIVSDAQTLVKQQVSMLRAEIRQDLKRSREVGVYVGVGALMATVGLFFVFVSLVFGLKSATNLAEWECWLFTGLGLMALGGLAAYVGLHLYKKFNPLPDQTLNALSENLSWKTNPQK